MSDFQRIVTFTPAYDKRSSDPKHNYGIGSVHLRMVLKGPLGATQFVLHTNWHLPHVQRELDSKPLNQFPYMFHNPQPADIGYHSPVPRYEWQTVCQESCEILDGKPCYYDGSTLQAEDVFRAMLEGGDEAVWKILEERYKYTFATEEVGFRQ